MTFMNFVNHRKEPGLVKMGLCSQKISEQLATGLVEVKQVLERQIKKKISFS